jgi:hypothetical protein
LLHRWWIPAEEVIAFVEVISLRIIFVTLKHVKYIQNQHLIVQKPAVVVVHQVLCPFIQAFDLAASLVVGIAYSTGEQPRICVDKNLLSGIKLAGDWKGCLNDGVSM